MNTVLPRSTGAAARTTAEVQLRAAISAGDLAPGQHLVEQELAERFAITRSSLRAAVDILIAERLVERIPHRGARVRQLSPDEAVEITECRMVLEGLLARKAAARISDTETEDLREHLAKMSQAVSDGDLLGYSALVSQMYELIHLVARHPSATELVQRLQAQLVRHQFQLSLRPGRAQVSLAELTDLAEAVMHRRPGPAQAFAESHLAGVAAILREDSHDYESRRLVKHGA